MKNFTVLLFHASLILSPVVLLQRSIESLPLLSVCSFEHLSVYHSIHLPVFLHMQLKQDLFRYFTTLNHLISITFHVPERISGCWFQKSSLIMSTWRHVTLLLFLMISLWAGSVSLTAEVFVRGCKVISSFCLEKNKYTKTIIVKETPVYQLNTDSPTKVGNPQSCKYHLLTTLFSINITAYTHL